MQYQRATDHFRAFLEDAREAADLITPNQTYTMVQGVLQVFRRRLSLKDAIRFAGVLPAVLRAIFVSDWDPDEPIRPFGDRESMVNEVKALRADHNFSPDFAIEAVATALWKHVDITAFEDMLSKLPEGAIQFWQPRNR